MKTLNFVFEINWPLGGWNIRTYAWCHLMVQALWRNVFYDVDCFVVTGPNQIQNCSAGPGWCWILTFSVKSSMVVIPLSCKDFVAFRHACKTFIFSLTLGNRTFIGAPLFTTSDFSLGFILSALNEWIYYLFVFVSVVLEFLPWEKTFFMKVCIKLCNKHSVFFDNWLILTFSLEWQYFLKQFVSKISVVNRPSSKLQNNYVGDFVKFLWSS